MADALPETTSEPTDPALAETWNALPYGDAVANPPPQNAQAVFDAAAAQALTPTDRIRNARAKLAKVLPLPTEKLNELSISDSDSLLDGSNQAPMMMKAASDVAKLGVSAQTGYESHGGLQMFVTRAGQIATVREDGTYRTIPIKLVRARLQRLGDMAKRGYDPKTKMLLDRQRIYDFVNHGEQLIKRALEIRVAKGLDKGILGLEG